MLNQRLLRVALWAPLMFAVASCAVVQPKNSSSESPLKLLIGDGGVRIEESHSHQNKKTRGTAAFKNEHNRFDAKNFDLVGKAWVEESSEFELLPTIHSKVECHIKTSRKKLSRTPASQDNSYIYELSVRVSDGIKDGPFEAMINGEGEGVVLFGEYPINSWQSTENLVLNDTEIISWFYEPKKSRYEITKRMGENRFFKKTLRFDPYLRVVSWIKYEILSDNGGQVDQQMSVLASLTCRS